MDLATAIRRSAPALAERGTVDHVILAAWLVTRGLSHQQAHLAIRFVPLAFGREILEGTGVHLTDTYVRMHEDGSTEERALKDEKFFTAAKFLAPQLMAELGGDAFTAIVALSPEFDAVNQAMNAGSAPQDLVMSPPVVDWPDVLRNAPQKPWWQFWS
jgi:hypothetical protein